MVRIIIIPYLLFFPRVKVFLCGMLKEKSTMIFCLAWQSIDGTFLLTLMLGIGTAILLVSSGISWLLISYPIPLWAFFFGLILASAFVLRKSVTKWNGSTFAATAIGFFIAVGVGLITPSAGSESLLYLFLCGVLVVIAMILPRCIKSGRLF